MIAICVCVCLVIGCTQVGAVIVGPNRVVLGIGYNGFPR